MSTRAALILGGGALLGGAAMVLVYAIRWRRDPSACPYRWGRFGTEMPRPLITRGRLRELLAPQPGEQVLEVGPGTGYYAQEVARWTLLTATSTY